MSYLEYNVKTVPAGLQKIAALNWPIVLLLTAIAGAGFVMLYSVADGQLSLWAEPQMKRFFLGLCAMIVVAIVPSWFWRNMSFLAYFAAMLLLLWVMFDGVVVNGARRWIELGPMRLQPSEVMKIALVMLLAAYYDWLPLEKTSHPYWVAIPVFVILLPVAFVTQQPDLGTSLLLIIAGATVMFMAGVHWAYFGFVALFGGGLIYAAFASKGTDWQILRDYQYDRIAIFLDPSLDPLGDGYHISQGLTAFGSGGWTGRGFMQGTQTQLGFLPEKQTDFIFNTLAEEFGFLGA
ncbi:MAG: FtsW/RodA/SpoVE family cell cycle protein, partial [Pseudomonadota bacterium]